MPARQICGDALPQFRQAEIRRVERFATQKRFRTSLANPLGSRQIGTAVRRLVLGEPQVLREREAPRVGRVTRVRHHLHRAAAEDDEVALEPPVAGRDEPGLARLLQDPQHPLLRAVDRVVADDRPVDADECDRRHAAYEAAPFDGDVLRLVRRAPRPEEGQAGRAADVHAALALANAYPWELGRLCSALHIEYQKDREGALLMRQMARPRKNRKGEKGIHWAFVPEDLARLITYCAQDIRCCRAIWTDPRLLHLTSSERQLQVIDAAINRRGVHFNRRFVEFQLHLRTDHRRTGR